MIISVDDNNILVLSTLIALEVINFDDVSSDSALLRVINSKQCDTKAILRFFVQSKSHTVENVLDRLIGQLNNKREISASVARFLCAAKRSVNASRRSVSIIDDFVLRNCDRFSKTIITVGDLIYTFPAITEPNNLVKIFSKMKRKPRNFIRLLDRVYNPLTKLTEVPPQSILDLLEEAYLIEYIIEMTRYPSRWEIERVKFYYPEKFSIAQILTA